MLRSSAELMYEKLTGIACLFKPADMRIEHFLTIIQQRLATGIDIDDDRTETKKRFSLALNQMSCRTPMHRVDIKRDQVTGKEIVVSSVDLSDTVQG